MTSGPQHRRARELAISLAVAGAAIGVIALTGTSQGLAVASSGPFSPDVRSEAAALAAPIPSQVVDDGLAPLSGMALPVRTYTITARFGERGEHWHLRHTGLDFKAAWGTPVYAVMAGTVIKTARHPAYGKMVILRVAPGVTVWYCHLSSILVKPGDVVAGQMLGRIGRSGNATGPHLHLEVRVHDRPTDPAVFLFGTRPGRTGAVPRWYPAVPNPTVASLQWLR
ncbi:MAG TPA: M23 family metallopeptidase [Candidatus Nanopelagicales bacterium]|nr:M23 family metallopeptidase [Candidatus Nanopelagicales bacterium]